VVSLSGVRIYQIMPAGHLSPDGGEGWGTDQLVAEALFSAPAEYISVPTTRNLTPPVILAINVDSSVKFCPIDDNPVSR
jgi:hypothetical protein